MTTPQGHPLSRHPVTRASPVLQSAVDSLRADDLDVIELSAGTILTEAGTLDHRLFVVLDGTLGLLAGDDSDTGISYGPGEVLGEIGYLTGIARTATVTATTDATVAAISGEVDAPAITQISALAAAHLKGAMLIEVLTENFALHEAGALRAATAAAAIDNVASGDSLFEADHDHVAIVLMGAFRVFNEHGSVSSLGRGEIIGELAWLNGGRHTARVVAARDSVVARFDASVFGDLVQQYPEALLAVSRVIADRLTKDPIFLMSSPPRPMSIAIIPAHPSVDVELTARALAAGLEALDALVITAEQVDSALAHPGITAEPADTARGLAVDTWLDHRVPQHEIVLFAGERDWSAWNRRIVRNADRLIIVADASQPPDLTTIERAINAELSDPHLDLLLLHPPTTGTPGGTVAWLEHRNVTRHHHVRRSNAPDYARAARRLAGLATGLVLGGGGARGFASIGVGLALRGAGIDVDLHGGTSMGALVAAGLALNGPDFMVGMAQRQGYRKRLHDPTLPLTSVFASRRVTAMLQAEYGDVLIEDLWTPFFAVATNLSNSEVVTLDRGPLWHAVRASIAIPGVFSPVSIDGDLLVDGGIMNNLPIDIMRQRCEQGPVLAVSVSPHSTEQRWDVAPYQSGWRELARRVNPLRDHPHSPSIAAMVLRSLDTNSVARMREHRALADLIIQPNVEEFSVLDWDSHDAIIEAGRTAAEDALADWPGRPVR